METKNQDIFKNKNKYIHYFFMFVNFFDLIIIDFFIVLFVF